MRIGKAERTTAETSIAVHIDLDGTGSGEISSGIAFFDHMLAQLAKHGLIDLDLRASGDIEIDAHHTVEDCGIVLGRALAQALGDRSGITRMADALVPLDDALARVVVDLSGRGYLAYEGEFDSERVGDLDTQLIREFLYALSINAGLNLHVSILAGHNDHHRAEALFKALARALRQAVSLDPRRGGQVPSTKGTLDS